MSDGRSQFFHYSGNYELKWIEFIPYALSGQYEVPVYDRSGTENTLGRGPQHHGRLAQARQLIHPIDNVVDLTLGEGPPAWVPGAATRHNYVRNTSMASYAQRQMEQQRQEYKRAQRVYQRGREQQFTAAVSYTHLTLPTKRIV